MYFIKVIYVIEKVSYNAFSLFEYFSQLWAPFNFEWFLLVFLSIFLDRYLNCHFWLISVLQMFTDFYCRRGFVISLPLPLVISLFAYLLCPSKVMNSWFGNTCCHVTVTTHRLCAADPHGPLWSRSLSCWVTWDYVSILFHLLFLWIATELGSRFPSSMFQYVNSPLSWFFWEICLLGPASMLLQPGSVYLRTCLRAGSHEMLLLCDLWWILLCLDPWSPSCSLLRSFLNLPITLSNFADLKVTTKKSYFLRNVKAP